MFQIAFQLLREPMGRAAPLRLRAAAPRSKKGLKGRARIAVCPPTARLQCSSRASHDWRERLGHWLATAWPSFLTTTRQADSSKVIAGAAPLANVRREFLRSLRDISTGHTGPTLSGIHSAHSLHELWHLRPDVFNLVARHHDQAEAERRLALLNRHFPTRAPRSGFSAFNSADVRQGEK